MKSDKPLENIKSTPWARRLSLAKLTASAGARAAANAVGGLWRSEEEHAISTQAALTKQIALLTHEFGQLKGSIMKAGQMLAMYGEHFLPPEAVAVLRSLSSESPPVTFRVIEDILTRELPAEALADLRIEKTPLGAASLGQVHRAERLSDGAQIALKVQYPGVAEAIDSDLTTLRRMFAMTKLMPDKGGFEAVYMEVKQMLQREMDYGAEQVQTNFFREALAGDPRYAVPRVLPELCSTHVLATSFQQGVQLPHPSVDAWSQERRNHLGEAALELYFKELFVWHRVQTDPHFGNYKVHSEAGNDILVLLDFGAVRDVPSSYADAYRHMIRGVLAQDVNLVRRGAKSLGFLRDDDPIERCQFFMRLCSLIMEPFTTPAGIYDWGTSDLPRRLFAMLPEAQRALGFRPPPAESVFLDRKLGGMFVFLSTLKVRIDGRAILARYLG